MIEYRFQGDKVSQIQRILEDYEYMEETASMKMHKKSKKKFFGYKLNENLLIHVFYGFDNKDLTEVQLHTLGGEINGESDLIKKLESLKPLSD